ncbi:MAG: glycosyltransferase family 2 protein [Pseudarthrobacter sp.]|nr:glycosyltransferase family 2 protein [Pseudarthrobacter sp.]
MTNSSGTGPRTSVILPAFNAAASLRRAAESVMRQADQDLELVIVDDASTDGTLGLARDLQGQYGPDRITVITQPANSGVSAARNAGLTAARGDWISFIDSDDEYLPGYLETLHTAAAGSTEIDIVVGGRKVIQADGTEQDRSSKALGDFDGADACRLAMVDELTPFPWDKLIRRSLFDHVRFADGAARFEDMTTNIVLHSLARKVRSIAEPVYRYYIMTESLTWGRIPTVADTTVALAHMNSHLDPRFLAGRYAASYACMRTLITMLVAQSAIAKGGQSPAAAEAIQGCRRDIGLAQLVRTATVHPVLGIGAALLKMVPRLYAALYRRHIRSAYGLS